MAFWVKYCAVAIVLSVAVYVGAPKLVTRASERAPAACGDGQAEVVATDVAEVGSPAESAKDDVITSVKRAIAGGIVKVLPPRGGQTSAPRQEEQEVVVENIVNYTPSTERIPSSGDGVKYWGVTVCDASVYDRNGHKRDRNVPGGMLVEVTDSVSSSRGEMALCQIFVSGRWAGPYLVATADLIRFEGGREEVDADDVHRLCEYFGLEARMRRREKELAESALAANPHYAELKRKAALYKEHKARAEQLTAQRDDAKGAERSKIISELTQLKNSEAREASELSALTKKYEDWKKAHPNAAAPRLESDAVYSECKAKAEALKGELAVFGL